MFSLTTSTQYNIVSPIYNSQVTKIKGIKISEEEVKLSMFVDDLILCMETWKNPPKIVLQLVDKFSKIVAYKVNPHKYVAYLHTKNEAAER